MLAAVGGLSGSGKSTFARLAAPGLGASPGAVVLRSDEVRKRLWGVGPLDRLPGEAYGPGTSERVYQAMLAEAGACLSAGRSVILDAVFLKPEERADARMLAESRGVAFQGLWLEADADLLRQRVSDRTGDASDADVEVLERQLTRDSGAMDWQSVPSAGDFEPAAEALIRALAPTVQA